MTNTNSALDKQNPSHELALTASNEVGFGWLGAYTGDTADANADERGRPGSGDGSDDLADANANEADDYRDEGREDFGWGGDEALCGE
jgi:hypothetical protein